MVRDDCVAMEFVGCFVAAAAAINQSINQSIDKGYNQAINQEIKQSIKGPNMLSYLNRRMISRWRHCSQITFPIVISCLRG